MTVVIFAGYLLILLMLALRARQKARPGAEDFFLASRTLGPLMLLLTLAATNFSAFTVFGFAGAGYRFGYSWYPIMAFGTGFMALTFILLGIPAHRAGKETGAITPPELIW
ncbi:MAG: sodium:solute symporter family protein, partial [candidate division WOR-3 bacterium]